MMAFFNWLPGSGARCVAATAIKLLRRSLWLMLFMLIGASTAQAAATGSLIGTWGVVGEFTLAFDANGNYTLNQIGSLWLMLFMLIGASTAQAAATGSLIGTWGVVGEFTLAFDANGNYTLNQITVSGTPQFTVEQLQVWPGIETGAYSWDAATGALVTACPTVDNNGTAGLSG